MGNDLSKCNKDFYVQYEFELYNIKNFLLHLYVYMVYQWYMFLGLIWPEMFYPIAEYNYAMYKSYRSMYSAIGVKEYSNQEIYNMFNLELIEGFGFLPGYWRCDYYLFLFDTFHWAHESFFEHPW